MSGGGGRRTLPTLGLMGAPGSGKGAVAGLLAERGGVVVDADRLAREALQDPAVVEELAAWWGEGVRAGSGGINRAAVGRIVFADAAERSRLEGVIHPRVAVGRAETHAAAAVAPAARFLVEDCPLLLETGLDAACDAVWFVDASKQTRLARVAARGWDAAELVRREAAQAPREHRLALADRVIENDGGIDALRKAVDVGCEDWLRFPRGASTGTETG